MRTRNTSKLASGTQIETAKSQGFNAVAPSPKYAPRNPYDEEKQVDLCEAWDEGADEAGINSRYTNGELSI